MKFPEMYTFRDRFCREIGADLIVSRQDAAVAAGANPWDWGTVKCCAALKTQGLLNALREGGWDAAFGGARRDEEKSRAKERIYSFRDARGQWDPKNQRPELWNLYNGASTRASPSASFPVQLDRTRHLALHPHRADPRRSHVLRQGTRRDRARGAAHPHRRAHPPLAGQTPQTVLCRFRTLGCYPCTGAIRSAAATVTDIIREMMTERNSERITRLIDHDRDSSMEEKKKEGYF